MPERILHNPPPSSFGAAIRDERVKRGHYGSYIVRGRAVNNRISIKRYSATENLLREKIAESAKTALALRGGCLQVGTLLHSIYQRLTRQEILVFSQHLAEKFIAESLAGYALIKGDEIQLLNFRKKSNACQKIATKIQAAFLDAKSLYVNTPDKGEDHKNQICQRVLRRFQRDGITVDDIRTLEKKISIEDVKKHRKNRLPKLIHLLGKILNYKCGSANEPYKEVIWEFNGQAKISFQVTDKKILVKASRVMPEGDVVSEIGTISDEQFERALLKWCENNPTKSDELIKYLNPMEEFDWSSKFKSPKQLLLKVLGNKELVPEHFLITLQIPQVSNIELQSGQFFHIICDPDGEKTLTDDGNQRGYALTLRRPFSIHRIHYANFSRMLLNTPTIIPYEIKEVIERPVTQIDILYKVVGEGTKSLSKVTPGTFLNVIGPIGNGFKIEKTDTAVIVAGGIGVAPLVALAERIRYLGSRVFLYLGALRKELLLPILSRADSTVDFGFANGTTEFLELINDEFKQIGAEKVKVCTDDGSLGEKGFVTEILERDIKTGNLSENNVTIYACGPTEMMKALSRIAYEHQIPCQVLLEERMACGIGACFSCTCKIRGKNGKMEKKRICADGPVFRSKDIIW
jgi:dihydroorotate dehydrogenase electron transfer subunit